MLHIGRLRLLDKERRKIAAGQSPRAVKHNSNTFKATDCDTGEAGKEGDEVGAGFFGCLITGFCPLIKFLFQ